MKYKNLPSARLFPLLFVCLSAEAVVKPFSLPDRAPAQAAVWSELLCAAAVCAALIFFFHRVSDTSLRLLRTGRLKQAKAVLAWIAVSTSFAGGACLVTAERFYRYVSDEPTLSLITAALILLAATYAVSRGVLTMTRAAGAVCVLFLMGAVLLAASSLSSARLENLVYSDDILRQTLHHSVFGNWLPAELLCFILIKIPLKQGGSKCACRAVAASAAFFAASAVLAELVLGEQAGTLMQPMHTLARLGGLSVFKRFDALHVGIWLLVLLLRQAFLLYGARTAIRGLLPDRWASFCIPGALALTLAGAFACSALPQGSAGLLSSFATLSAFGAVLLFSFCTEVGS